MDFRNFTNFRKKIDTRTNSGDISPYTPFTRYCLNSLSPLMNFSAIVVESGPSVKEEEKEAKKPQPCGCSRTKCLKLYCECFSNNRYCVNCQCKNCKNKPQYEEIRDKAKLKRIEKNPTAFLEESKDEVKGCHCKKSGCKKKYCECFEVNKSCSASCKCEGCQNIPIS